MTDIKEVDVDKLGDIRGRDDFELILKKRLIKYQMERRLKKIRKFARKRLKQFLNDVWGK